MTSVRKAKRDGRSAARGRRTRMTTMFVRIVLLTGAAALMAGCSLDGILKSDELPTGVTDPAITESRQGAVSAYHGLIEQFRRAFGGRDLDVQASVAAMGGLLGDELQLGYGGLGFDFDPVDARSMIEGVSDGPRLTTYSKLQRVRGQASQAIGLLVRFAPEERALAGHAYTLQAYSEIFLAELFCSGIPLSTLDYEGDYTLRPGSTTAEVYAHALALLDTALALVEDGTRFAHLARMAQARVFLDLGELAEAAATVAEVPDDFEYEVEFLAGTNSSSRNFALFVGGTWPFSVSDREGLNGVNFRSSEDPRSSVTATVSNGVFGVYHPDKYAGDGGSSIVLASGLEARLIEAEADLAAGGSAWLGILNTLRNDGTYTVRPDPVDPAERDTTWHAGSGGTEGLAPLADPDDADARVDLLFRERAFWLFLTGHRHADLRRLVRNYGRPGAEVYPTGAYPATGVRSYGSDVTIPIPVEESIGNPLFTGCISRGA